MQIPVYTVDYPSGCTAEGSRLSWCIKAQQEIIAEHNVKGALYRSGKITREQWLDYKSTTFRNKYHRCINRQMLVQLAACKTVAFFKASLTTHVVADEIVYPAELDEANEGSRLSFLLNLIDESEKAGDVKTEPRYTAIAIALSEAWKDAVAGTYWTPDADSDFTLTTKEITGIEAENYSNMVLRDKGEL